MSTQNSICEIYYLDFVLLSRRGGIFYGCIRKATSLGYYELSILRYYSSDPSDQYVSAILFSSDDITSETVTIHYCDKLPIHLASIPTYFPESPELFI